MAEIVDPLFEVGNVVGVAPADGIVAAIADDGAIVILEAWDPVQGDALHYAPAGSVGGGGTRRHLFDREVYVDTGGAVYVNVRAFASLTGVPTTVQGYGITNAVRTDLGATQNIDNALTLAGALTITTNATYFTGKTAGAVSKRLIGVNASGLVAIDADAVGATLGAGVTVAGVIAAATDAAHDLGAVSFRFRAGYFSGTVTATTFAGALTGNASTATALANARNINGVAFDGTTNITVTAAAGTLTGTVLNATVVTSSLTSVGTLTALDVGGAVTVSGSVTITTNATHFTGKTAGGTSKRLIGVNAAGLVLIDADAVGATLGAGVTVAGVIAAATDAAHDLGAVSFRFRAGYFSGTVTAGAVSATTFTGALTGNASTATALANARNINGVAFDGTTNITVTAAAGTLTGTTLVATVVTSSLTSVGTLGALTMGGTIAVSSDNAYDLASSGTRFRHGYFAGNVTAGGIITHNGSVTASGGPTTFATGVAQTVYTPSVHGTYILSAENSGSGSRLLAIFTVFRYDGNQSFKVLDGDGANLTSAAVGAAIQISYGGGFGPTRDIQWTIVRLGTTSY